MSPIPLMKPWWRSVSTVPPGVPSSISTFGAFCPRAALTHLPCATPAARLSVANVASTALSGSVAVSRAMTRTPLSRACLMAARMPEDEFGVMRMPDTPWLTRFSIAETWPSLSPSNLPANAMSFAPSASAAFCAASRMLTKYGLESVLVTRPILTCPEEAAPVFPVVAGPPELHAVMPNSRAVVATAAAVTTNRRGTLRFM